MAYGDKQNIEYRGATFIIEPAEYWRNKGNKFRIVDIKNYGEKIEIPTQMGNINIASLVLKNNYSGVKEIVIPNGVDITALKNSCFPDLESVVISPTNDKYSTDGRMLFDKSGETLLLTLANANNETVTVPKGVKKIANYAFENTKCVNIVFENPNTQITDYAFSNSKWIKDLKKRKDPVYFGNTFYYAASDDPLVIKPETNRFYQDAFSDHVPIELTTHIIPFAAMSHRGYRRYSRSQSCRVINLTMESKKINFNSFSEWENLEAIHFTNHKLYKDIDGIVFSKDGKVLIFYPRQKKDKIYTVPDGTKAIGRFAFSGTNSIEKIIMPDSVKKIYQGAFSYCYNLSEIILSDNITELPDATAFQPQGVFDGCHNLKKVHLPKKLTHIGAMAFKSCSELREIEIPNKVQMIGEYAFLGSGLQQINLPKSLNNIGKGSLMFSSYDGIKVSAYEGTARGLIGAIEAVAPGENDSTANLIWRNAEIIMLNSKGEVKDKIIVPQNLKKSSGMYIDIAWNQEKFDYDEYDECFADIASGDEKMDIAVGMITSGRNISDTPYESYLRRVAGKIIERIINSCDEANVVEFLKYGFLSKPALKKALTLCNDKGLNTASAYILNLIDDGKAKKETAIRL